LQHLELLHEKLIDPFDQIELKDAAGDTTIRKAYPAFQTVGTADNLAIEKRTGL
jgi:hypothetical protein